jgi:Pro-kumamolisin, activation domain/Putative Ig domain
MRPSARSTSLAGACAGALVVALLGASPASAVRLGTAPALPSGARIVASLTAATPMHVTVTLRPRDPATLLAFATGVSTPGSPLYRGYLTPAEFAQRFGATPEQIRTVESSLRAHGLRPGRPSANALSIPVSATAGALGRAFSVSFAHLRLRDGAGAIVNRQAPSLDRAIAPQVQTVLGLDTLSAARPLLLRRHSVTPRAVRLHVVTGGPQACPAASAAAAAQGGLTADQVASVYGFSGLYGSGGPSGAPDQGAGQTVAVLELESYDPTDIATYEECYGTNTPITNVPIDGGAGGGAGAGEAALDIENVIGLAPSANLVVYSGPNSGSGPYDTFSAIISQHAAQVVTASWGQCEPANGFDEAAAENTLFQEAAAQGMSILSASGDGGAEDCFPTTPSSAQVDDPASQPFVTGVGGTRIIAPGPRPTESVWNDGPLVGAGGGGISSFWRMPAYQSNAPSSLHVIGRGSSGSPCRASSGYCREVPDVSADAAPDTGYLIYWNGNGAAGVTQPSGWQVVGGTSGAAPMWAALIALANASAACNGVAVGFANPGLYYAAATAYASDFNDITSGDNDMTGASSGRFAARPGYDMATGLGSPNGSALATSLCADAIALSNPGPQRSALHAAVGVQIEASDTHGAAVSYSAAGLPAGLSIKPSGGRITGRPRHIGTSTVTVTASDPAGTTARNTFRWTIQGNPTLSQLSLAGVGESRPSLAFTLAAGRGAPLIRTVRVTVPRALRFTRAPATLGVTGPGGRRLKFTVALQHGTLVVKLRRGARQVRVTIAYPRIEASDSLAAQVALHRSSRVALAVQVTDAGNLTTKLSAKLRPSA